MLSNSSAPAHDAGCSLYLLRIVTTCWGCHAATPRQAVGGCGLVMVEEVDDTYYLLDKQRSL